MKKVKNTVPQYFIHILTFFSSFPSSFSFCSATVKSWNSIIINGSWQEENSTAGGCRNFPTFTSNPQYTVDLEEDADGDGKCSVLIALMQKNRRKQKKMGVQDLCIGFSIYKVRRRERRGRRRRRRRRRRLR